MKNVFRDYYNIIKYDCDWDYAFVLILLKKKFERMRDFFECLSITEGSKQVANELNLAIRLIDIINMDNSSYSVPSYNVCKYVNIRNCERFNFKKEVFTRSPIRKLNIMYKDDLRQSKAWHLLWRLIELKMQTWWD